MSSPCAASSAYFDDADLFWNYERERQFCTDFVCCGLQLKDLYALLRHYEERHVQIDDIQSDDSLSFSPCQQRTNKRNHVSAFPSPCISLLDSADELSDDCSDDGAATAVSANQRQTLSKRRCLPPALNTAVSPAAKPAAIQLLSPSSPTSSSFSGESPCLLSLLSQEDVARNLSLLDAVFVDPAHLSNAGYSCSDSATSSSSEADEEDETDDEVDDAATTVAPVVPQTPRHTPARSLKPPAQPAVMKRSSSVSSSASSDDAKRLACPVDQCSRSYKNQMNLKQHLQHHHRLSSDQVASSMAAATAPQTLPTPMSTPVLASKQPVRRSSMSPPPMMSFSTPAPTIRAAETALIQPHACPMPGCSRTYASQGGLKYHLTHAHTSTARA
ncbi:Transcriptional regulator of ribosomal biogenesis protein [Sorochytrium milnesiophthora]